MNLPPKHTLPSQIDEAVRRVPPLWPLERFVAVDPFMGLPGRFEYAANVLRNASGARMTAPRRFYAQAIDNGRICDNDLAWAIDKADLQMSVEALSARARLEVRTESLLPTVAGAKFESLLVDRVSSWAASYFDRGHTTVQNPWRELSPFAAWREEARRDRTPELHGLPEFRKFVASLPSTADQALAHTIARLELPASGTAAYLHRAMMLVQGWAGHARFIDWEAELRGEVSQAARELLAVVLAWECGLLEDTERREAWRYEREAYAEAHHAPTEADRVDHALQLAFERSHHRDLFSRFGSAEPRETVDAPSAQLVFCIDVRSEPLRRAIESARDDYETLGFAGFFGFAIEESSSGAPRCPALIAPAAKATTAECAHEVGKRNRGKAWSKFKTGGLTSFAFVEAAGLTYVWHLLADTFLKTRRARRAPSVSANIDRQLGRDRPPIRSAPMVQLTGVGLEQQVDTAEGALRGMGLIENFGKLVVLTGHGSSSVNNPYASGLECGACGGHAGDMNSRVAVRVLNEPAVRKALVERGISIPDDTRFVAALHDTTTDDVRILDRDTVPDTHGSALATLEDVLARASEVARSARVQRFFGNVGDAKSEVVERAADWSAVRPEYGLAGCAAFVVAPRHVCASVDFEGKAFLHSYDADRDPESAVLEVIMTAPMVVGSWINLQYYASTVDADRLGSGNKTLHNVVGRLGVLEGNGGDLRVGLPLQSVHNGERFMHEPLRLSVFIEAPREAIGRIVEKHESVTRLAEGGWIHLFSMADGKPTHYYSGANQWRKVAG